ncbi:hypothetical protein [Amycolatopsis sp. NPDC051372]
MPTVQRTSTTIGTHSGNGVFGLPMPKTSVIIATVAMGHSGRSRWRIRR